MKKLVVSVNGKKPFETRKKADIENLFEQMFYIRNNFHMLPSCYFTVTGNKTVVVDWKYLSKNTPNGTVFIDRLVDKLLEEI